MIASVIYDINNHRGGSQPYLNLKLMILPLQTFYYCGTGI
jgi:hypothetical protein